MKMFRLFALGIALLTTSCATIVTGTTQDITINSAPQPAEVHIYPGSGGPGGPEVGSGRTPMGIALARDKEYTVNVSSPGYQDVRVKINKSFNPWVIGNICCFIIIGGAIDLITGAFWKLEPNSIVVTLVPGANGAPVVPGTAPATGPAPIMPAPGAPGPQPIMPAPTPGSAPPAYSPTTCNEGVDLYAVMTMSDSNGDVRSIAIPMIRDARTTQTPSHRGVTYARSAPHGLAF
jgi:hypothetical protein